MNKQALSRRDFLRLAGTSALAAGLCPSVLGRHAFASESSHKPNIIVMMVDDMGFSDLGCYGSEIKTPNLDRLANNGVRLTKFYNTSRCCPSRASILTGLYPHQTGLGHFIGKGTSEPAYRGSMHRPHTSLAEVLNPLGYDTSVNGKWHVFPRNPKELGFKRNGHFFADGAASYFKRPNKSGRIGKRDRDEKGFYSTDWFTDGVINDIERNAGKQPFFIYYTPTAPHWPLHAKEADFKKYYDYYKKHSPSEVAKQRHAKMIEMGLFDKKYPWSLPPELQEGSQAWKDLQSGKWKTELRLDTHPEAPVENYKKVGWQSGRYDAYKNSSDLAEVMAVYAAQIDNLDQNVGRILAKLEEKGELENTLITFCSDNGCSAEGLGTGPLWTAASDTPFLKYKMSAYEGGVCSPFIMHYPKATAKEAKGTVDHQTAGHLVDIMSTVIGVSGASYHKKDNKDREIPEMEGRSLMPVLQGKHVPLKAPIGIEHGGNCALITEDWKLTSDKQEPWRLYDLNKDRFERVNVAKTHPDKVKELSGQWQVWAERVGALRGGKSEARRKDKAKKEGK